jgi:hypothetical protein
MRAGLGLLLLLPGWLGAQGLIRNYGEERAGTTVLQFLKIGVGARAEGMGQAFVGVADDASALYWNPAGLARLEGSHASFHRLQWPAEIGYDYLGFSHRLSDRWALGLAYGQLSTGEMPLTSETHPDGDGRTFTFTDQALQLSAALRLTHQFSFGASLKYVREDIAETTMDGWLMDLGTYYDTGWRDLSIAVALVNFGPQFRPEGSAVPANASSGEAREYEDFSPPTIFRLGGALTLWRHEQHRLLTALQVSHPVDNAESYLFGSEYSWDDFAFLRGGWKFNAGEESWTAGAGIKLNLAGIGLRLDLSYSDFGLLEDSRRLSTQFDWEGPR